MAKIKSKRFDFTDVERMQGASCVPAGKYVCVLSESEYVKNSAGTGKILKCTFTIKEGDFKGRKIFAQYNLENESEMAEKIAWEHYKTLHLAIGHDDFVDDTKELHGKPLILSVKVKKDEEYGDKNEIKDYLQTEEESEFPEEEEKKDKKKKKKNSEEEFPEEGKKKKKKKKDK